MAKEEKFELPENTAKLYKLAKNAPAIFVNQTYGDIDVRKVSPDKAQKLIDAGCKHIIALPKRTTGTT